MHILLVMYFIVVMAMLISAAVIAALINVEPYRSLLIAVFWLIIGFLFIIVMFRAGRLLSQAVARVLGQSSQPGK